MAFENNDRAPIRRKAGNAAFDRRNGAEGRRVQSVVVGDARQIRFRRVPRIRRGFEFFERWMNP